MGMAVDEVAHLSADDHTQKDVAAVACVTVVAEVDQTHASLEVAVCRCNVAAGQVVCFDFLAVEGVAASNHGHFLVVDGDDGGAVAAAAAAAAAVVVDDDAAQLPMVGAAAVDCHVASVHELAVPFPALRRLAVVEDCSSFLVPRNVGSRWFSSKFLAT